MGGGTLSLEKGGGLDDSGTGELDLTNSTLELAGPFKNDGGVLTTSQSTLRLQANTQFQLGNEVTFDTYEPYGWGLLLYNNQQTGVTRSLTLGTELTSITIEPNADSLTSGFVDWYHNEGPEYNSGTHAIGIAANDTTLIVNGDIILGEKNEYL